ncbi:MAG: protease family protein [Chloroflexota bacterium]|nr:protease family protein [Chloroflexota bacterium]
MVNKKALGTFLGITFGTTLLVVITARLLGLTLFDRPLVISQLVIGAAMFIPAGAALITQHWVVKKPLRELGLRFGPAHMYAKTYAVILLLYVLNYGFTWLFLAKPDFSLSSFMAQYGMSGALPLPAPVMIAALTAMTLVGSPLANMIPSLGEELGWRGFLLPALEPLGRAKAALLSGMIWALWHTPMILLLGFGYGHQSWPGFLLHFVLISSLGVWMAAVWFKTRSTVLAAFMHAVFNANAYGVWSLLFVSDNKLVIGAIGLVNTVLLLGLGILSYSRLKRQEKAIT